MRTHATKQPKPTERNSTHPTAVRTTPTSGRSLSTGSTMLQRKPSCACGGGCPRCQEKALLQTKLKISEPGDRYEQEADRIADEVMRIPESAIQRQVEPEEEEEIIQRKAIADQNALLTQTPESSEVPTIVHDVLKSPGQPLDPSNYQFMKSRFGYDFSQVRVHTDIKAAESARAVDAQAYTIGKDIVFGTGQYAPNTLTGQRLLGHELVHIVQQGGVREPIQRNIPISQRFSKVSKPSEALKTSAASVPIQNLKGSALIQRAMLCSKRLEAPVLGWVFNHAYVDDTGQDDCLGSKKQGNLAIQQLKSGNFRRGCALKTDKSDDPKSRTPNKKPCNPKPGIGDVSACLRQAYSSYTDPSYYANPGGPNSNTFVGTLARACCADASWRGLGLVPGWNHSPAGGCVDSGRQKIATTGSVTTVEPSVFHGELPSDSFDFSFTPPSNPEVGKAYVLRIFFVSNGKKVAANVQFRLISIDNNGTMHWKSTNSEPVNVAPVENPPQIIKAENPAKS